jgi:hypothetical protein
MISKHRNILDGMYLVLHEAVESIVDHCRGDGCNRNMTNEDDLDVTIVLYVLVDESSVLQVRLRATS